MSEEKSEGLVLKSLDFRDRSKIITVFTPYQGLISLIVKGINRKKTHLLTLTSPFTRAEYHYLIKKSTLYSFRDGTPLATHSAIRKSFHHIQTATEIASALLASQLPGKAAPKLYQLTLAYLKELPHFEDPSSLASSFLLKLLKHEGHLHLTPTCSLCGSEATHFASGESLCAQHRTFDAHPFTPTEWEALQTLESTRTFAPLKTLTLPKDLKEKIQQTFQESLS